MCKHILFNNFDYETDIPTLREFAQLSYERDGYGAIARNTQGDIWTFKDLTEGSFYSDITEFLLKTPNIDTLVVHHRTSTNKKGIEYAHPFDYKGFYLTHNGVINTPYKYNTKTQNDSEELLHHLIDTNYDTKDISGYYSTFIVSEDKTQLIVDFTAPIYSDGRVYSSHNLGSKQKPWKSVQGKHLVFEKGVIVSEREIEIKKSLYGQDKAHLSLGWGKPYKSPYIYDATVPKTTKKYNDGFNTPKEFFDNLSKHEDFELSKITDPYKLEDAVWDKSLEMGLWLGEQGVNDIVGMYLHSDVRFTK